MFPAGTQSTVSRNCRKAVWAFIAWDGPWDGKCKPLTLRGETTAATIGDSSNRRSSSTNGGRGSARCRRGAAHIGAEHAHRLRRVVQARPGRSRGLIGDHDLVEGLVALPQRLPVGALIRTHRRTSHWMRPWTTRDPGALRALIRRSGVNCQQLRYSPPAAGGRTRIGSRSRSSFTYFSARRGMCR